jgi:hypothetical protein
VNKHIAARANVGRLILPKNRDIPRVVRQYGKRDLGRRWTDQIKGDPKKMRSMKNRRKDDSTPVDNDRSPWKTAAGLVIALLGITIVAGLVIQAASSENVIASPKTQPTPKIQGHFVATKRIIVDEQTGKLRMPTSDETDKLVADLANLTKRPTEDLKQVTVVGRGTSLDLDGGYAGVMIGRPNADGTTETRCVFSFEEAVDFLGLVEE